MRSFLTSSADDGARALSLTGDLLDETQPCVGLRIASLHPNAEIEDWG
jgi:hypothetical protein